jgi:hypothetical protein
MFPFEVFVELVHRFPDVLGLYDMVAIEDRAGFVTRDQHRNLFRHPGANQVPYTGSAKVVQKFRMVGESRTLAG